MPKFMQRKNKECSLQKAVIELGLLAFAVLKMGQWRDTGINDI